MRLVINMKQWQDILVVEGWACNPENLVSNSSHIGLLAYILAPITPISLGLRRPYKQHGQSPKGVRAITPACRLLELTVFSS